MNAEGSSSAAPVAPPNILTALRTLLLSSAPKSPAYTHPFAPATKSWKGKAREGSHGASVGEQQKLLANLSASIQSAQVQIGKAAKEEGKTKLARAMKEVVTHQSALLPLVSSFTPASRPPCFRQPLPPIQLLEAIAQRLGIETYLEESQFGLLKTTLAIAGKRFVLDVEVEVDSATGVEEDAGPSMSNSDPRRGKVRLAKILVNHVTKEGGTASSASIGRAVQAVVEEYLVYWNGERTSESEEKIVERLWEELGDLAGLDSMTEESGRDWFAELEQMAEKVGQGKTVLPSFEITGEVFRIRPAMAEEHVVDPLAPGERCDWIIESPGLVVRRNWLGQEVEGLGVPVEQLLYKEEFPYSGIFVHSQGLEQRWCLPCSGPSGFVIGRCGFSEASLPGLVKAFQHQVALNNMIKSVLSHGKLQTGEDTEVMDLFAPPTRLPITMTIETDGIIVVMPFPHSNDDCPPTLTLNIKPSGQTLHVDWRLEPPSEEMAGKIQDAVDGAQAGGTDVVEAVSRIEAALREA